MRINEWNQRNQNAAKMNGSGGVQGKGNTKKLGDISTKSCKIKPEEDSFRSSLQKSMVQEEAMKAQVKKAEEAGRPGGQPLRQDRGMKGSGACSVYVEKKSDDGTWKAYVYDGISSRKDSRDEMERMAYMVASAGSGAKSNTEV